jgi:hypothetical protein
VRQAAESLNISIAEFITNAIDVAVMNTLGIPMEPTLDEKIDSQYEKFVHQVAQNWKDSWDGNDSDYDDIVSHIEADIISSRPWLDKISNVFSSDLDSREKGSILTDARKCIKSYIDLEFSYMIEEGGYKCLE